MLIILAAVLAAVVIILLIRLRIMRKSMEEISIGFSERLRENTNAPITISSADRKTCQLAAEINKELVSLRSERRKIENKNTEVQRAVTNVAHDLRTPVTAISGYLELLEQENLDEKPAEYVKIIRERTDSLKDLTEELFRYSVADATSDELTMEYLSLNDELEVALAAAYQSLTGRGITPEIDICGERIVRKLDRKALQRVLGNILNNAARYSDGDLRVSLNEEGIITFSNTASSLSEIEAGRLFDRFYTVENAKGSTGLGLSIARLLTEKMGGKIRAGYDGGVLSIILTF